MQFAAPLFIPFAYVLKVEEKARVKFLQNVGKYLLNYTAKHTRGPDNFN
jgi:hypothetical protein